MYRKIALILAPLTVVANNTQPSRGFLGMQPYSTLVGYEPGSLVTEDAKTHIVRVFLPRQGVLRLLSDQRPLDLTEPTPMQAQELTKNVTSDVRVALGEKADSTADAALKLGASKIKTAKMAIEKGSVRSLVSGDLALEEVLRSLSCQALTDLYGAMEANSKVALVTEVATVERGAMSVTLKSQAGAGINALAKVFGVIGSVERKVDSSFVITYDRPQPVGYHSRPIDKKRVRAARDGACNDSIVGAVVEWKTGSDGKDHNSTPFFHWLDGTGNLMGVVNGCCNTFPFAPGSTHSERLAMNQVNVPLAKIDHGSVIIRHNSVGRDDWDYTVTLWALLTSGRKMRVPMTCSTTAMHPNQCTW